MDQNLEETKRHLEQLGRNPHLSWTPSGYQELDALTGGLVRGGLNLIAARPAMGQTSLVLNIVDRLAEKNPGNILVISAAQTGREIAARLFEIGMCMELEFLLDGTFPAEMAVDACREVLEKKKAGIVIEHITEFTLEDIRNCCYATPDLRLVVVDGLEYIKQYVDTYGIYSVPIPQREPMDKVMRTLRDIACELNVPLICTAHLHRSLENRKNKRPSLTDLKKIGLSPDMAEQIIFLYRDNYYNCQSDDKAEWIVAKTSYGKTGTVELYWDWRTGIFHEVTAD